MERLHLRSTQSGPGTGEVEVGGEDVEVYDLTPDQGSPTDTIEFSLNDDAFTPVGAWIAQSGGGDSFPLSVNVDALDGDVELRFWLQRLDAGGAVQDESGYSQTFSSTGVQTDTIAFATLWDDGDRLRLVLDIRRSGGHGSVEADVSTQDPDSWVEYEPASEDLEGDATVSGGGSVSVAGLPGHEGSVEVSGGGSLDLIAASNREGSLGTSGGGSVFVSGLADEEGEDFSGAVSVSGGGSVSVAGLFDEPGAGSTAVSGGGVIAIVGSRWTSGSTEVSGGGSVTIHDEEPGPPEPEPPERSEVDVTVDLIERIGTPPGSDQVVQYLHLRRSDRFSGTEDAFSSDGIRVAVDGSRTYSMERWFRFRFSPPFNFIRGFRFWAPGLEVPTGWIIRYGVAQEYKRPVSNASLIATNPLPTSRPESPNVGGLELMDGTEPRWSDWIVLQASADAQADPGAMVEAITYEVEWQQA